jgi:hypothetical protein
MGAAKMTQRLKDNWFWPLVIMLSAFAAFIARTTPVGALEGWEVAVVFDVLVTIPVLFALCYRAKLTRSNLIIRVVALQCLGIWLATKIVPVEAQSLLPQLAWLRYAGLAILVVIELRVMVALFNIVFKADTSTKQLEEIGMPPFLAKLALLEARFWRRVFSIFRR